MSRLLVSILIPAYNAERWLREAISSAVEQTWPHKEVIVVDDGSTDRTLSVAKSMASKFVKVVAQINAGACTARNRAYSLAQGDYIQWLDADDLLHPEKIAAQLSTGEGRSSLTLLTAAWGRFFTDSRRAVFAPDALWRDLDPATWIVTKFVDGVWMNPASWLVSRRLTELAGAWDDRLAKSGDDDGEYLCRLIAVSTHVRFVPTAKCYYRIGVPGSLGSQRSDEALRARFLARRMCIDHMLALEDSERTRRACVQYLQDGLAFFYPEKADLVDEARTLAQQLGGRLTAPSERAAFRLLRSLVGWRAARRARATCWRARLQARRIREELASRCAFSLAR